MKKIILTTLLLGAVLLFSAFTEKSSQRIIIDVTSTNFKAHQSVVMMLNIMTESHPETEFDVIVYGEAVPMLQKEGSMVTKDIVKLVENPKVKFTACEVSMRLFSIGKDQLVEGVTTVENAVDEIVRKQQDGWGYIKSGG